MANTRELRRRIRSVKNTSQITKAMQMVAATKMRKAQSQAFAGRPYAETLNASLTTLLTKINPEMHPLLKGNNASKTGVVLLSTDKGLVGALNTNIIRATLSFIKEKKDVVFFTIGRKGRQAVAKTGNEIFADFENLQRVTAMEARQITKLILEEFNKGALGEVFIIYPDFVSALRQEPRIVKLLPIDLESLVKEAQEKALGHENENKPSHKADTHSENATNSEFLFEPNPDVLLDFILVHSIETKIYQALLETKASEYSAQMIAMQNATDNAKELVSDLELAYNQTRQEAITTQLLEITTAAAAMQ